jgi:hypothetical protein
LNFNSISEHFGIEVRQTIEKHKDNKKQIKERKFPNNKRATKLINAIKLETWESVYIHNNTESKYVEFHNTLLMYRDKIIPVSVLAIKENSDSLPPDALTLELIE